MGMLLSVTIYCDVTLRFSWKVRKVLLNLFSVFAFSLSLSNVSEVPANNWGCSVFMFILKIWTTKFKIHRNVSAYTTERRAVRFKNKMIQIILDFMKLNVVVATLWELWQMRRLPPPFLSHLLYFPKLLQIQLEIRDGLFIYVFEFPKYPKN